VKLFKSFDEICDQVWDAGAPAAAAGVSDFREISNVASRNPKLHLWATSAIVHYINGYITGDTTPQTLAAVASLD